MSKMYVGRFLVPGRGKIEESSFCSALVEKQGKVGLLQAHFSKMLYGSVAPCPWEQKHSVMSRVYGVQTPGSISNPVKQKLLYWGTCDEIVGSTCYSWEKSVSLRVFLHARAAQGWAMHVYLCLKRVVLGLILYGGDPEFLCKLQHPAVVGFPPF